MQSGTSLAFGAVAVVLGVAATTAPQAVAQSPRSGVLAFTRVHDGAARVFAVHADGSALRQLTRTRAAAFEGSPAYSPDGSRIAYVCGNYELCVMNADGSAQARLTTNDWPRVFRYDSSPAWSPDGRTIAFTRTRGSRDQLWLVNADASAPRQVPVPAGVNANPAFSPDATRIAFDHATVIRDRGSDVPATSRRGIYVVELDGNAPRRLTGPRIEARDPSWSPDGRSIAFTRSDEAATDIVVMNADGTGLRRLTTGEDPAWSPDGDTIALASNRGAASLLHLVASTGGVRTRLTGGRRFDGDPAWQPIGAAPVADRLPSPTTPPSRATPEARLVGSLSLYAGIDFRVLFSASDARSAGALDTAARRTRAIARRVRSAVRRLRPTTRRGRSLRRQLLMAAGLTQAIAGELRAASRGLRRGDRRAANRHRRDAGIATTFGLGLLLAKAGQVAGVPLGDD